MRLERLWLNDFKNLKELEIEFGATESVNVLVGRNGTGKSNLLEALVVIFRDLDLTPSSPTIKYSVRYTINDRVVELESDPTRSRGKLQATVDGASMSMREFTRSKRDLLPAFVFGYYSGPSNRFREHFDPHQNRYYNHLLANKQGLPLRTLFLAESFHSQFVLLAFLLEPDDVVSQFLEANLGIEALESVEYVLHQPGWARSSADDLWSARGVPRHLMEILFKESVAPVREQLQDRLNFRQSVNREHLWLFFDGIDAIRRVYSRYNNRQDFFKALESLVISDLLHEMRVTVRVRGVEGKLEFRELSEGEQQLLVVLGLLRFTQADNSLLLLDEPDTHLNPAWSLRYAELLDSVMGPLPSSQVLLATHDPLVIASLVREQVILLERTDERVVRASHPERDPRGMGVASLLTSEIYGLRSQLDLITLRLLDEKRLLASKEDRTPDENFRLDELRNLITDVDLAATVRDPLYREFVEAMTPTASDSADAPLLTREERDRRTQLVHDVVAELQDERPGDEIH